MDQTFEILPSAGYSVADVIVDGASVGAISSYIFSDVNEEHTISATFKKNAVNPTPSPTATPAPVSPIIISGDNGKWTQGSTAGLTFSSDAAYKDFNNVSVDGKVIDQNNYTVSEGSTVVTLKAEYLATLATGNHTIAINSKTGVAFTAFTIEPKSTTPEKVESPETGDNSGASNIIILLFVSCGVLTILGFGRKNKKVN